MSFVNIIYTSISNLRFHKLRSFLTMIGIIIGISSIVAILSIGNGFKNYVVNSVNSENLNKINIYFEPKNLNMNIELLEPFSKNDIQGINNITGVKGVEVPDTLGSLNLVATNISYFDKNVMGSISFFNETKEVKYGRWFNNRYENNNNIVLEYNLAKSLFDNIEDCIGSVITINDNNFEVIGVLSEKNPLSFDIGKSYIPKRYINRIKPTDNISSVDIFIKDGFNKKDIFSEVSNYLVANHTKEDGEYKMEDPEDTTKAFESIIGGLTKFIAFITGISLIVGGIGVMNIMYVSVSERKREIGIRRAIGAEPNNILLQFLVESIIITFLGGLIGIIVGYILSVLVGAFLPFTPILTVQTFLGSSLISILEGIIFGLIPANKACKLHPIEAIYK